ncbi:MAG: anti-sigma factor [Gluconacetobacter diazotrophicus]|nr:anti-sigma factor [Gluconacetobacter diazotrophicus]
MIGEEQQERAALYALELLDGDEAAAFEREAAADGELRALADELREAAATLARSVESTPPPGLKARVVARAAAEGRGGPVPGKVTAGPWRNRVPWAAAAALAVLCGVLGWKYLALQFDVQMAGYAASFPKEDALRQVAFCPLEPVPAAQQTAPQAAVLWDAARRRGQLRIRNLPPPAAGKDYQLWTVEEGRKEPVSAGVVKLGANGSAETEFEPQDGGNAKAVAFALSLERAGGAPTNEGPILYLGKL